MKSIRNAVCSALMAVQLAGCTSWRAQSVTPRDLPGFVAAYPASPLRFTLGNGIEMVVSQARVDGDTVIGTALGHQVRIAVADIGMVARRRTNALRTVGLVYAVVGITAVVACGATDCFSDWYR